MCALSRRRRAHTHVLTRNGSPLMRCGARIENDSPDETLDSAASQDRCPTM
jgi:hypothetical protein